MPTAPTWVWSRKRCASNAVRAPAPFPDRTLPRHAQPATGPLGVPGTVVETTNDVAPLSPGLQGSSHY